MVITRTIVFTIFWSILFSSSTSLGQTRPHKFNYLTLEMGMSAIYNRSNEIMPKLSILLLFKNNIDLKNSPKSGLLYGIGFSNIFDKKNTDSYISTGFEYFNGFLEMDGKMHVLFNNGYYYYLEPQIGIYLKKRSSVLLLGYNFTLNRKSPTRDIVGVTLSYSYKLTRN